MTKRNWMISPDTHPRSAPEAENVIVNRDPGVWGLFVFPSIELPPPGTAFSDTRAVLPIELLDVLNRHGQDGTWWFAKVPPKEGSTGEPRYLTITSHGAGSTSCAIPPPRRATRSSSPPPARTNTAPWGSSVLLGLRCGTCGPPPAAPGSAWPPARWTR